MIDSNKYVQRIIAQREATLHQLAVTECLLDDAMKKIADLELEVKKLSAQDKPNFEITKFGMT